MTVLTIIGVLLLVYMLFAFIAFVNRYTESKYDYEFFSWANYIISGVGYGSAYFGHRWYTDAVLNGGDILNGQILMGIGLVAIVIVVYINIKRTNIIFGLIFSIFQQLLYIPFTAVGAFVLIMLFAALADTKPVYKIN